MSVTLNDVAKAAGVSIATASRALTDSDHPMDRETRKRVLRVARELGYTPNPVARGLRLGRTFSVGIILSNIVGTAVPILRGALDQLTQADYLGFIIGVDQDPEREAEAIRYMVKRSVDGIIFVDTFLRSVTEALPQSEKPFVFINRRSKHASHNSVYADNRYSGWLATQHLLGLGHRRIALINGPQEWDASQERLLGYRSALAEAGIELDEKLVYWGDWTRDHGYAAARELLRLADRPTAFFGANDLIALGIIYAAQDAGLRVPQDVAVVGHDDRNFAEIVRPALTTVSLPAYEMGQVAARQLVSLLEQRADPDLNLCVKGRLRVRESCGSREPTTAFGSPDH